MKSSKLFQKFLLLVLTLLMVLASGCGREPERDNNIPPIASGPDYPCPLPGRSLGISGEKSNGYVAGQIVFTGIPDEIVLVVDAFGYVFDNPSEPLETIDLPPVGDVELDLAIRLYQLNEGEDVWETVGAINDYILTNEDGIQFEFVFSEPNYVTSLPVSGSPGAGGSGGISGDPSTGMSPVDFGKREFLNQWAFTDHFRSNASIGLYDSSNNWTAKNSAEKNYIGLNIEIAVFDTVPSHYQKGRVNIGYASVPFDLCIWKPGLMIAPAENYRDTNHEDNIDLQDHGLFVTGLAQGAAPGARYFLIEALNAEAQGDVISLLFGVNEYVLYRRGSNDGNLNNTVINLSLGLELENDPNVNLGKDADDALDILREVLNQTDWVYSEELSEVPYPSVALKTALTVYEQEGAMIVAAAGNNGKEHTQIPAGFSNVLGVSSNNIDPSLSCFSNYGDVAAPGGEGEVAACDLNLVDLCAEYSGNIGDCPFAVISLISRNPAQSGGGASNPGFGYWAGTSMSTPMVSGLAALIFEKCAGITPAGIRGMIETAAFPPASFPSGLGVGVINVENTLALDCPSSP